MEQWTAAGAFNATPGQEISEAVYNAMLNAMPPLKLPQGIALHALHEYNIPVHAGFLMGEPADSDSQGQLYLAFGSCDFGKGARFYYLGTTHPEPKLNGTFYYFDCMNAFVNGGLFPADEFDNDAEAIRKAADYEATLYKYTFKNGRRTENITLYEPAFY